MKAIVATINGITKPLKEWCVDYGLPYATAYGRLKSGWTLSEALQGKKLSTRKDRRQKVSSESYELHATRFGRWVCCYCGMKAPTVDHVQPISWVEAMSTEESGALSLMCVPACTECNGMLGSTWTASFEERRELAKIRIRLKHADLMRVGRFSKSEVARLGGATRIDVREAVRRKTELEARLGFSEPVEPVRKRSFG